MLSLHGVGPVPKTSLRLFRVADNEDIVGLANIPADQFLQLQQRDRNDTPLSQRVKLGLVIVFQHEKIDFEAANSLG